MDRACSVVMMKDNMQDIISTFYSLFPSFNLISRCMYPANARK